MIADVFKLLAKGFALLLITAMGGYVGATFGRLVGGGVFAFFAAPTAGSTAVWSQAGWVVGAVLFSLGYLFGKLRVISSSFFGLSPTRSQQASDGAPEASKAGAGRSKGSGFYIRNPRPVGVLLGIVFGAFGGTLLGGSLGASFLLLWFSFACSPFAPGGWASSVAIEKTRVDRGVPRERPLATTQHPVALYAFFGPVALGASAGAVFGGICAAKGKAQMS
ncbi:MAG: hypothetical protein WBC44_21310 [Planctomycetaceae bacterium]